MKTKKTVKLLAVVLALAAGTSIASASAAGWALGGVALGLGGAYLLNNANYGYYNYYPNYYGYGYYGPTYYSGYYGNGYYSNGYDGYYGYGYYSPYYSGYWY